jgi:hypothetical protein
MRRTGNGRSIRLSGCDGHRVSLPKAGHRQNRQSDGEQFMEGAGEHGGKE